MAEAAPRLVPLEGGVIASDLSVELFWSALGARPLATLRACLRHAGRPAARRAGIARLAPLRLDLLPTAPGAEARIAAAGGSAAGVISTADKSVASRIAAARGLAGPVLASDGRTLMRGRPRAAALSALGAAEPGPAPRRPVAAGALLRALRPHQWVKNVLLLLPMIAAHDFTLATLWPVLLGVAAFSLGASAIYVVNDLLDLDADRLHPTKRHRPFASGQVPARLGTLLGLGAGAAALALGLVAGPGFLAVLVLYMVLSLAYSLRLKRLRWIDIFTLAMLYTLRVVAGAAAGQIALSLAMLVFVFPIFLVLGCVKRMTELAFARGDARLPGRGYGRRDRGDLLNMAALGTVATLVIFAFYTTTGQAQALYPDRWILWLALLPMALWLLRMVLLGYHGRQDHDPIVFALRDLMGLGLLCLTLSLMFWAAGLWAEWFG